MENIIAQNNKKIAELVQKAKKEVSVFRKEKFEQIENLMWLDLPNANELIAYRLKNNEIDAQQAEECKFFANEGYIIYPNLFSNKEIDDALNDVKQLWQNDLTYDVGNKRLFNKHYFCSGINNIYSSQKILNKLNLLINRNAIPYQSITSLFGSEQLTHSDAIHMTTFPLGFLTATWVALEDIHEDSGPLFYYPKSHKLAYFLSDAVGIKTNDYKQSGYDQYHKKYEPFVAEITKKHNFEKKTLLAKKGDVLVWHHNLLHGGSFINNKNKTRKSIVCHYYAEDVICYHDLANTNENLKFMKLRNKKTYQQLVKFKNRFSKASN